MRETYVFQNAFIMFSTERPLITRCSIHAFDIYTFYNVLRTLHVRHGPFDIQGGGGGLGFWSGPRYFFRTKSE